MSQNVLERVISQAVKNHGYAGHTAETWQSWENRWGKSWFCWSHAIAPITHNHLFVNGLLHHSTTLYRDINLTKTPGILVFWLISSELFWMSTGNPFHLVLQEDLAAKNTSHESHSISNSIFNFWTTRLHLQSHDKFYFCLMLLSP